MDPNAKKKLIGAVIAAACAIAVYYGLIDQKQSNSIQNQADQTLGTAPAQQQQNTPQQNAQPTSTATTQSNPPPAPGSADTQNNAPPASANPAPHPGPGTPH